MKTLISVSLLIAAGQLPVGAVARDLSNEPRQQVVRYSDLDLTHQAGAAVLFSRLRAAARDVCEPVDPRSWRAEACSDSALARAVADVDAPALTDYYLSKTGQKAETFEAVRRERAVARIEVSAK